jgi:ubiquinone/menaquinone biosynthesis C-methylase UbiE
LLPIHWWLVDRFSRSVPPKPGLSLPPARLRFRVAESVDAAVFFRIGERAADDIEASLRETGYSMSQFHDVLDLGCGCGRVLMWLAARFPEVKWNGSDTDSEAIQWCRSHIKNARFAVNEPLPPLPYADKTFDLIYGVSVFTHLSEDYQRAWIPELRRVLRSGGVLLITFHSEHTWRGSEYALEVERQGLLFRSSKKLKGIMPDWYQTTLQTPGHLLDSLSKHFTVVGHSRRAFGDQDAVIARRD